MERFTTGRKYNFTNSIGTTNQVLHTHNTSAFCSAPPTTTTTITAPSSSLIYYEIGWHWHSLLLLCLSHRKCNNNAAAAKEDEEEEVNCGITAISDLVIRKMRSKQQFSGSLVAKTQSSTSCNNVIEVHTYPPRTASQQQQLFVRVSAD